MNEDALGEALRALGHSDRRAFVRECRDSERSAGDLAEMSRLSLPSVSEHLKVLRKSGLLILDRRGRHWMYRTDPAKLAAVARAISELGGNDGA